MYKVNIRFGTLEELGNAVDILLADGPVRGLHLSTAATITPPSKPKTTLWSPLSVQTHDDPLNRGIPVVREEGVVLLGAPLGSENFVGEVIRTKIDKIRQVTNLLPDLQDPHTEFALLRSCLALPKLLFLLRTVDTTPFQHLLAEFDSLTREALTRILGSPIPPLQWEQAKLPVTMAGMGLRAATDHAPAAYVTSFLTSQTLVQQLLNNGVEEDPVYPPQECLDTLTAKLQGEDEMSWESFIGQSQKMVSCSIDQANQKMFATKIQDLSDREKARLASLSLEHSGDWLNCPPIPALGIHLRGPEFVVAAKFRLGLDVYDREGACPACGKTSDTLGDHGLVCGTGGERISRHNSLRDALFDTAVSAGLSPTKEARGLLPGSARKPGDVFLPHWSGGLDAALDVTITHPLQNLTVAEAAVTPGHAMSVAYERKMRGAGELCRGQGIAFIPVVAESLGGLHGIAVREIKKIGAALARHTGEDEGQTTSHLFTRVAILIQRGLAALLLNRIPDYPSVVISGDV